MLDNPHVVELEACMHASKLQAIKPSVAHRMNLAIVTHNLDPG